MSEALQTLHAQGWEIKSGQWWAPGHNGKQVPMWSREVLDGPAPDKIHDADVRRHTRIVRASIEPLYRKAWTQWLMTSLQHKSSDYGFAMLAADEQKALAEGTDTTGGFAVPADFSSTMISVIRERSLVRQEAITIPTSRDVLTLGVWDNAAEWIGEVPSTSNTTLTLQGLSIPIGKAQVKVTASNDLVADQGSLIAWLTRSGGDQLALLEERGFIAGGGTPAGSTLNINQPLGFIWTGNTAVVNNQTSVAGTTGHTISNTTSVLGSVPLLITLDTTLADTYRTRSRWFCAGATLAEIRGLSDGSSRQMFPSAPHPLNGEDTLMAHPITTSTAMPADGVSGNRPICLVDLSQYIIGTRSLLTVRIATETYGDQDQTLVYVYDRIGGALSTPSAIQIGTV